MQTPFRAKKTETTSKIRFKLPALASAVAAEIVDFSTRLFQHKYQKPTDYCTTQAVKVSIQRQKAYKHIVIVFANFGRKE